MTYTNLDPQLSHRVNRPLTQRLYDGSILYGGWYHIVGVVAGTKMA